MNSAAVSETAGRGFKSHQELQFSPLAQLVSASLLQREGPQFEPVRGYQFLRSRLAAKTLARLARYPGFESLLLNQVRGASVQRHSTSRFQRDSTSSNLVRRSRRFQTLKLTPNKAR